MNQILTMREKRASLWDAAKKYRDSHIGNDGTMSAEDAAVYDRMVDDVDRMKKEIDRLERQEAIENEMNRPTAIPILGRPENPITGEDKKGRASDSYKKAFWQNMRSKSVSHEVFNALQIGTDSEGGFLVPDEYERTLVDIRRDGGVQVGRVVIPEIFASARVLVAGIHTDARLNTVDGPAIECVLGVDGKAVVLSGGPAAHEIQGGMAPAGLVGVAGTGQVDHIRRHGFACGKSRGSCPYEHAQAHEQGHEQGQRLSQCFHRVTSLKWPQAAHRSGCAACGWILFTF